MFQEIVINSHHERLRYLVFLHNLMNFNNSLYKDCDEIYCSIIENKINSISEPYLDSALKKLTIEGDTHIDTQGVYCAFHFGCYRLISRYLHSKGVKHTIILNIRDKDEEFKFSEIIQKANRGTNIVDYVNIVRRRDIIKLKRHLSEGRNLLIYADANLSAFDSDNNSAATISFMNKNINVAKGVWYFSNKFRLPIYPIISLRDQEKNILRFENELKPSDSCIDTLQKIWKLLECFIIKYPKQWEGWLFANNLNSNIQTTTNTYSKREYYKFNNKRYNFLNYPIDTFSLYDVTNNEIIRLNHSLYQIILKISQKKISIKHNVFLEILPENIFINLISRQVFI